MKKLLFLFFSLIIFSSLSSFGQSMTYNDNRITVGVLVEPPFVIKDADGSYYGISIDLWYFLSDELDIRYEFKEYQDQWSMLRALNYKEVDICINPFHVSGTRLNIFEVSQPFFISSLGIAAKKGASNPYQTIITSIFSFEFFNVVLVLMSIIIVVGMIVWVVERHYNNEQFDKGLNGLGDGIWWATVTMTTVGYGDKTPKTIAGRLVSVFWMFAAMIVLSGITASMTSKINYDPLNMTIERPDDLKKIRKIGTVSYSSSEDYLVNHKVRAHETYENVLDGLRDLNEGKIDVFVYDKPVMRYMLNEHRLESEIRILPITFNKQYRSFLMPKHSELLTRINPELVDKISIASWQKVLDKYNLSDEVD